MRSINLWYWITTCIFSAFMIFSAIPDILREKEAVDFIRHLGYPDYFIPFIGVLKLLGSLVILDPGNRKIKEWAYAGLAFDLIGAFYSNLMVDGFQPGLLFMIPISGFLAASWYLNQKRTAKV
jgi:hypothetical protein